METYYANASLVIGITCFVLAILVYAGNKHHPFNQTWTPVILSIAVWATGLSQEISSPTKDLALFWNQIFYTGGIWLPITFYRFVRVFCEKKNKNIFAYIGWISAICLQLIIVFSRSLFIADLGKRGPFQNWNIPGPAYYFFTVYYAVFMTYSIAILWSHYREVSGFKKQQTYIMLIASLIGCICGATNFPLVFGIPILPYGHFFIILYPLLISWAIIRYRALDMNLVMRWGMAYGILATVLGSFVIGFLGLAEKVGKKLGTSPGFSIIIISCLLVFIFDPLRKSISKFIDQFIFKSPDFLSLLKGINESLGNFSDLNNFTENISKDIKSIWKLDHAGIGVWDRHTSRFIFLPPKEFENLIVTKPDISIGKMDYLIKTLESERRLFPKGIIVEAEVHSLISRALPGERTSFQKIRRTMRWIGADICIPLNISEELIGFIILGPKKSKNLFNNEDKKFLSHLADIISEPIKNFLIENNSDSNSNIEPSKEFI